MPGEVPVNVADTVRGAAARAGQAPALIGPAPGAVVTWNELDSRVDAVAAALLSLGLPVSGGAPARVAIALPQSVEFAEAFFGVLRAGFVAVPVNPAFTARELSHALADSGATLLLASAPAAAAVLGAGDQPEGQPVRAALPALARVYATEPVEGARRFDELRSPAPPVDATAGGEDLAVLLYTSGTSGAPKGAMLPHRALLANQRQVAAVQPAAVGPGDVVLLALPLFHVFGLNAGLVAVAHHAATGVLLDRFEPVGALRAVAEHRVSVVGAVPQMYAAWLAAPGVAAAFADVRVAVSGGAPLPEEVAVRFGAITGRAIRQGYGLTETAPVLTMGPGEGAGKPAAIGRPVPGVQVRLLGAAGSIVAELGADGPRTPADAAGGLSFIDDDAFDEAGSDPGEIVVRGENLFVGYWPDGAGGPDTDGWWRTGDVAYVDADGDLHLVDRLGDLIIVNGFNVYPKEVEQVLLTHPGVAEAAVIGIPDPATGEAVHAFVVPATEGLSPDELRVHCGRNLARYKCPVSYDLVAALPRSAIGKVRKTRLSRSA